MSRQAEILMVFSELTGSRMCLAGDFRVFFWLVSEAISARC